MLFERTCRIAQNFDWFLRFVPQNSVEKRKNSKNYPETCTKTGSTILSPACLGMFEPSKTFFMFLFVMPVNQNANAAQLRLKSEKSTRIIQKAAYKKQAARFFRLPVLGMFEPSKTFFMFLFVMPVNQNANAAQFRLKSEKSTKINQKTAQKQAARFFRLPVLGMFEPSKAFFHVSFYDTSESECQRCTASIEKRKNSKNHPENCTKNRQHDSFACLFWECLSHQRRFSCFCL